MTATRWLTRALAALVAVALLVGSLLVVSEIAVAAAGGGPWLVPYPEWATWMQQRGWTDRVVRAILLGLVVVGLLLLFLAVRRGKPATLPLRGRTPGVEVTASRRSVERSLVAAASRVSGITGADAAEVPGSTPKRPAAPNPACGRKWSQQSRRDWTHWSWHET